MKTSTFDYQDGKELLEGYFAYDDKQHGKKPGVLICHDWTGKNNFACEKANQIAKLGYVGFALDMFGKGKQGKTKEEKSELIAPFMQDRSKLLGRINAALLTLRSLEVVDVNRIAIIGFCFGGLCALDLARSGVDIKGAVSFHGLLQAPPNGDKKPIKAKVLALHGFEDPMADPQTLTAFCNEMTEVNANWQVDVYGHTVHAFTNPEANDPDFGTIYNKQADTRSWIALKAFLAEIFA